MLLRPFVLIYILAELSLQNLTSSQNKYYVIVHKNLAFNIFSNCHSLQITCKRYSNYGWSFRVNHRTNDDEERYVTLFVSHNSIYTNKASSFQLPQISLCEVAFRRPFLHTICMLVW